VARIRAARVLVTSERCQLQTSGVLWVEDAGGGAHAVPRCVAGANEPARRFTSGTAARTLRRRRESARKALDLDSYEMLHLCWL